MMRSAFLRLVLAALLLAAQHAALTHSIWHAYGERALARQAQADNYCAGGEQAPEPGLCVFHVAFGQVVGGAHGSASHFFSPGTASEPTVQPARSYSGIHTRSFQSRAPPVFL